MRRLNHLRILHVVLVLLTSAAMTARLWTILRLDGTTVLEIALVSLFAVLSTWVAWSFWLVCLGAWMRWRTPQLDTQLTPPAAVNDGRRSRIAVVMPIYNEDVSRCMAGIQAIRDSVHQQRSDGRFEYFLLSDSTDADCWRAEERAWKRLPPPRGDVAPIYYRHRPRNIGRKSGNIAEFCRNWGARYDYMVVLDADSLMTGETLVQLARLMDANPRAGLIQAPPRLVGRQTLFARAQQFASSVYGPIAAAGLAALNGPDGNYWGHNAILRVQAFMDHCGLPELPGRAPLGGEILSHDFVEAALLRRAGWEVWMAPQLEGSYEEVPPTVLDFLKRDRRWCQGNLQHIRLIFARGFRMSSRLHFASGAMAYLASPLWLALLVVAVADATLQTGTESVTYVGRYPILTWVVPHAAAYLALLMFSMGMLFGQKLIGLIDVLRDRNAVASHGGVAGLTLSVLLDMAYSTLLAPVFMLTHTWFVLQVLLGGTTGWGGQQRTDRRLAIASAAGSFAPHTVIAGLSVMVIYRCVPDSLWWFMPLLLGLALAIPLATLTSSTRLGRFAQHHGLFLIPSETEGLPVLARVGDLLHVSPVPNSSLAQLLHDTVHPAHPTPTA
jgi:membrane glycosyltransferase